MSEFLVPGATVFAALLALTGVLVAQLRRKPVEVTDLWTENRKRQEENDDLRSDLGKRDRKLLVIGEGFDASTTINLLFATALEAAHLPFPSVPDLLTRRVNAALEARNSE